MGLLNGLHQRSIRGNFHPFYNFSVSFSMCQIDVEWFPFDAQTCEMKFGYLFLPII